MPVPIPSFLQSAYIRNITFDQFRCHRGDGDMWPTTWADDGFLYGAAGDNMDSPMNFWRIHGEPQDWCAGTGWGIYTELVHPKPVDPKIYCQKPYIHPKMGVKPASLLCINGVLYMAVELHNYGDNPSFNRQHNIQAWVITSTDYGKTWNLDATPKTMFTGRLASPHFLQFGRDYAGARDEFVYAYFSCADDGQSYWENGDQMLLGRVNVYRLLERQAWEFYMGLDGSGKSHWVADERQARAVFRYPSMTGENHVCYNPGLQRYLLGNYAFLNEKGESRPYHTPGAWPQSAMRSQLTLFEAREPWGPWMIFYKNDHWGTYGDYQPSFPTKWISADGCTMLMASSGSFDDYNLTLQKVTLEIDESRR